MDSEFYRAYGKGFLAEWATLWKKGAHSGPILGEVRQVTYHHGQKTILTDLAGRERSSPLEELGSAFEVKNEAIEAGDAEQFSAAVRLGIERMRSLIVERFVKRVGAVAEESGNSIDLAGRQLTADALCEMLERIDIAFDANGQAR